MNFLKLKRKFKKMLKENKKKISLGTNYMNQLSSKKKNNIRENYKT